MDIGKYILFITSLTFASVMSSLHTVSEYWMVGDGECGWLGYWKEGDMQRVSAAAWVWDD